MHFSPRFLSNRKHVIYIRTWNVYGEKYKIREISCTFAERLNSWRCPCQNPTWFQKQYKRPYIKRSRFRLELQFTPSQRLTDMNSSIFWRRRQRHYYVTILNSHPNPLIVNPAFNDQSETTRKLPGSEIEPSILLATLEIRHSTVFFTDAKRVFYFLWPKSCVRKEHARRCLLKN